MLQFFDPNSERSQHNLYLKLKDHGISESRLPRPPADGSTPSNMSRQATRGRPKRKKGRAGGYQQRSSLGRPSSQATEPSDVSGHQKGDSWLMSVSGNTRPRTNVQSSFLMAPRRESVVRTVESKKNSSWLGGLLGKRAGEGLISSH